MAEAKKNNCANIENITSLLGGDGIDSLLKNVQGTEKKVSDILRKLSDLEAAARQRAKEEAARAEEAAEPASAPAAPVAERQEEKSSPAPAEKPRRSRRGNLPARQRRRRPAFPRRGR